MSNGRYSTEGKNNRKESGRGVMYQDYKLLL